MRNIFVISDTHFGHAKILTFLMNDGSRVRPEFDHVEEMNEHMIEKWNSVVRDNDIVYHLGDVYFGDGHICLSRLRGKKRLILGNHDDAKDLRLHSVFQKITLWRIFKEFNCMLTHVPVHESSMNKVNYNLHGHIHRNKSSTPNHINCSVEASNYTPRSIEDIMNGKYNA
jgi:calcineurin-like phosphoesterase family protein